MSETLAELQARLAQDVEDRVEAGYCGCGCGEPLGHRGGNGRRRYLTGHRQRAHRRRLELEAELVGIPTRLSLETLQTAASTDERNADAQKRPRERQRRPLAGVRVYFPTVELAELARTLIAEDGAAQAVPAVEAFDAALARRRRRAA